MGVKKKTRSHTRVKSTTPKAKSAGATRQLQASNEPDAQATAQERIWQTVALIPEGRVATYGQIAELAGMPRHARLVGRTLRELPRGSRLPWHRVVNASLKISFRHGASATTQRRRLEAEGVEFIGQRVAGAHRWEARAPWATRRIR